MENLFIGGEAPKPKKTHAFVIASSIVVLLLVAVLFGILWHTQIAVTSRAHDAQDVGNAWVPPPPSMPFPGSMLFATVIGNPTSTKEVHAYIPSVINAKEESIHDLGLKETKRGDSAIQQMSFSRSVVFMTFLGLPHASSTSAHGAGGDVSWSLYRVRLDGPVDHEQLLAAFASATPVSLPDSEDYFRNFPAVNDEGTVLYNSLSAAALNAHAESIPQLPAEAWNIVMLGLDGKKRILVQGVHPKWITATAFAFLKNDGMYVYDIDSGVAHKILSSKVPLTMVDGLDVSDDGRKFVYTEPQSGELTYMRALNQNLSVFTPATVIQLYATNPIFSSDGTYVAFVAPASSRTPAQVRFLDSEAQSLSLNFLTIDASTIQGVYLSDWH